MAGRAEARIASPVVLGTLGAVAGAISGAIPCSPSWIPSTVLGVHVHDAVAPLHTPVVFAAVVYYGLWRAERRGVGTAVETAVVAFLAWFAAINWTVRVGDWLERFLADHSSFAPATQEQLMPLAVGPSAGAVGSLLVMGGAALLSPACRTRGAFARALVAGGLAGVLLNPALRIDFAGPSQRWILLFVVWQGAVAAIVGQTLNRSGRHQARGDPATP